MQKKKSKLSKGKVRSALVETAGRLSRMQKSPDELLGELFNEAQLRSLYSDSKTFVDLVPKKRVRELKREYELARQDPDFALQEFVQRHFQAATPAAMQFTLNERPSGMTAREHVSWLWPQLTRQTHKDSGSLFALPYRYIVPGGRFEEQFYWDTYFIMLGLAADKEWDLMHGMMRNYIFMADKFGHIPTANRTYFTSRSQPPFFAMMVRLMTQKRSAVRVYVESLPTLVNEYRFWMKGRKDVKRTQRRTSRRVVKMPDGTYLNRYYDNKSTPRPESHREDVETAETSDSALSSRVFQDLRAAAESGWDFSSRWFADYGDIRTIHTTDFVPIDLNCLLYILELTIADGYKKLLQPLKAKQYRHKAAKRAEAIREYLWDDEQGWFMDYDIKSQKRTSSATLAGVFALYASLATEKQAAHVAKRLEQDFLKAGGLVTTFVENGQQWDRPNGWAPLQWVAVIGLRNYGYDELAEKVRENWMKTVEAVYDTHEKMIEKYDVVEPGKLGGGGEYPLQDGFGWTNGVYAAFADRLDDILLNKR